jgi:hypothetical protein
VADFTQFCRDSSLITADDEIEFLFTGKNLPEIGYLVPKGLNGFLPSTRLRYESSTSVLATLSRHMLIPPAQAGPPNGLGVQVLNTPLPVTGDITGTVKAKIVSTPFFQSSVPTCDATNRCSVKFPAVPTGKRLRVTRIHGALYFSNDEAFVALDLDNLNGQVFVVPVHPFAAAYLGATLSFNESTDVVFTAGQTPIVEMGTGGRFFTSSFNRLGITGDLQDVE